MSKKCFATVTLYAFVLVFMVGTAYFFSYVNFTHLIGKIVIIVALLLGGAALAIVAEKASALTLLCNAILWGTALSFLFDNLDLPPLLPMVYVILVMVGWFLLFCFLANFSFAKENHTFFMICWGAIFIAADVAFAVLMKDTLGWAALILIAPFLVFFGSLPGAAENFTEHAHHIAISSTIPALLIVMLFVYIRYPYGSHETPEFFPETDEDYLFTYCPETDYDDEEDKKKDLSDFM